VTLRFADCQLDLDARRLLRGAREIHLSPKAFDLLRLLIESRPRAIAKSELLERIWPGVFVTDGNLASVISEIRGGVGDPARRPRIVRTVHAFGYAFVAEIAGGDLDRNASAVPTAGTLWFVLGRRRFPLGDGEHIVGREPEAAVWLDSPKVSRHHARITVDGVSAILQDLDSKNGVFVRGERVAAPRALESGDEIRIGPISLLFRVVSPQMSTEAEAMPFRRD